MGRIGFRVQSKDVRRSKLLRRTQILLFLNLHRGGVPGFAVHGEGTVRYHDFPGEVIAILLLKRNPADPQKGSC